MPFVRVNPRPPVPAEKYFSARLAVKQLHNSRPALAGERRRVVKLTDRARRCPGRGSTAVRVRTNPQSLKVSEEQMRSHWQRRRILRTARSADAAKQSVHRRFPVSGRQRRKEPIVNL